MRTTIKHYIIGTACIVAATLLYLVLVIATKNNVDTTGMEDTL